MQESSSIAADAAPSTGVAALMALGSMVSVQLGAALARPVMETYGTLATTWGRLAWAAVVLGLVVRPRFRSYGYRQVLPALMLGAAIAMMTMAFFVAIERMPLGLVVATEFLGPLTVAAFGFLRSWRIIWLVLALGGVLALVLERSGWSVDPVGFGFALLAALGWGSYILLSKRIGQTFKGLEGLAISFVVAALVATPFGLAQSSPGIIGGVALHSFGLAILTPLLPFALEMTALKRLPTATFGILMSAEPGIGALAGYLILGEHLNTQQMFGIAAVICASAGAVMSTSS